MPKLRIPCGGEHRYECGVKLHVDGFGDKELSLVIRAPKSDFGASIFLDRDGAIQLKDYLQEWIDEQRIS